MFLTICVITIYVIPAPYLVEKQTLLTTDKYFAMRYILFYVCISPNISSLYLSDDSITSYINTKTEYPNMDKPFRICKMYLINKPKLATPPS